MTGFGAKARAGIEAALRGIDPKVPLGVDVNSAMSSFRALQQRIAQLGLADFADTNIPVGKLAAQFRVLKRLMNQSGLGDFADLSLDPSKLQAQLAKIGQITETVKVGFDVAQLPIPSQLKDLIEHIKVVADATSANSTLDNLKTRMTDLSNMLATMHVDVTDTDALAKISALQAKLLALVKTVATLTIGGDTTNIDAAIAKEQAKLAGLQQQASSLQMDADTTKAIARMAAIEALVARLRAQMADMPAGLDKTKIDTQINALLAELAVLKSDAKTIKFEADATSLNAAIAASEAKIAAMQQQAKDIKFGVDVQGLANAEADLLKLEAMGEQLSHMVATLQVNADGKPAEAEIAVLMAKAKALAGTLVTMRMNVDDASAEATIAKLQAQLIALTSKISNLKIGIDVQGFAMAEAQLLAVASATDALKAKMDGGTASMALFTRGTGGWIAGLLGGQVALFAGATAISLWHLALDAAIEVGVIAVTSLGALAAGLGAFAIVATQAGDTAGLVADHLKALNTVSQATGQAIPPLTDAFNKLTTAVRPQVWGLYGDAINAAGSQLGLIGKLGLQTGGVLDTIGARIVVDMQKSGGAINTFITAGQQNLAALGGIMMTLGNAFANLIKAAQVYHIAEDLLAVVGAAAQLFDWLTKIPTPILAAAIAMHGFYIWGGLAVEAVSKLAYNIGAMAGVATNIAAKIGAIGGALLNTAGSADALGTRLASAAGSGSLLGKSLGFIGTNPWVAAVAVGVIAITALAIWMSKAKDATDQWVTASQKAVQNASIYNLVNTEAAQLVGTNQKLADATSHLSDIQAGNMLGMVQSAHDLQELAGNHALLNQQLSNTITHADNIANTFGTSLPGAYALAAFAGVKVSDMTTNQNKVWDTAMQKIQGVITGYKNMGQGMGQIGNDISAVSYASSDQLKAITNLNNAWDTFTKNLAGPTDTFISLANSIIKFGSDAQVSGAQMTGLGSGVQSMSKKVTDSSLQLQQDFQDTFKASNQLFDAMRTSQAPADIQIQAIKDTVAVLIPMAGHSKLAAAEVYGLAQEADYAGNGSLKDLSKWAGITASQGLTDLQTQTQNAAIKMANLSQDAQNLANALQQDLTADMAHAVAGAVGLQGAMDNFAKAVHDSGAAAANASPAHKTLYNDLIAIGLSSNDADAKIAALSGAFSSNAGAADAGKSARQLVVDAFNAQSTSAKTARSDVDNYTTAIQSNGVNSDAAKSARQQLITDMTNAGVNAKTAQTDVQNYSTAVQQNGATSSQAQAARQQLITDILGANTNSKLANTALDNYTTAIKNNGINSDAAKAARQQLITDMINAQVNSKTANTDVDNYTTAIRNNGINSDAAKAARQQLITDILNASGASKNGKTDMDNLTTAVQRHGSTAQTYQPQRQKLIDDLVQSGVSANNAKTLVDNFISSIQKIPAQKTVGVYVQGQGAWTITQGSLQQKLTAGTAFGAAGGAIVPGYGPGRDTIHAMLSPGEGILVPEAVKAIGPKHIMDINKRFSSGRRSAGPGTGAGFSGGGIPSFAGGGVATAGGGFQNLGPWVDARYGDTVAAGVNMVTKALTDAINAAVAAAKAAAAGGGDIVADAKSWIGKIPYVWGGTTLGPAGADCSGFVQAIYARHGINAPRTSEAQGAWVKRGGATPGGLAFYHSPAGGADPGHVAIVADGSNVVSQGGGMGPQMMGLRAMPLLWTGIPPGGLPAAAAAGSAGGAAAGSVKALAQQQAAALGWTGALWNDINALEMREAGWNLTARNPSSGAYGIAQFINGASEYAQYGGNSGSASGQIVAFYNYIAQRYGNPAAAWAHEVAYGWYGGGGIADGKVMDRGGTLPPGKSMVWNATGKPEPLVPASDSTDLEKKFDRLISLTCQHITLTQKLISTTASVPVGVGHHIGGALNGAATAASYRNRYPHGGA